MRPLHNRFFALALCAALLASMLFAGCSPVTADATALVSPPKLTKEQQAIEQALDNALGGAQYTLKYPRKGDYRSSFVLHSFDGGTTQSVLAFYSLTKDHVGTHVMLLSEKNGAWRKVADLSGDGNEVDRVAFGNFDGGTGDDLLVGWTSLTSTDLSLSVYSLKNGKFDRIYRDTYAELLALHMTDASRLDLLLLKPAGSDKRATASLVSLQDGALTEVATAPLDSTVTSYAGLYATTEDGSPAVLIDGYKNDSESVMVTELLLWQNGALSAPLYDKDKKITSGATLREVPLVCQDTDGDGSYEIPVPQEMPGYDTVSSESYSARVWRVQWKTWKGGALQTRLTAAVNIAKGYQLVFPQEWLADPDKVTVRRMNGDADWAFYEWDAGTRQYTHRLFDIYAMTESALSDVEQEDGVDVRLGESGGIVYAARVSAESANSALRLGAEQVRAQFRLLE